LKCKKRELNRTDLRNETVRFWAKCPNWEMNRTDWFSERKTKTEKLEQTENIFDFYYHNRFENWHVKTKWNG